MATIDTLQDSVDILTSSTTAILNEVNVSKATLVNSKDLAEAAAVDAEAKKQETVAIAAEAAGSAAEAAGYANVLGYNFVPTVKPTIDLDFADDEHGCIGLNGFVRKPLEDVCTIARGSKATYYDARGRLCTSEPDEARLTFNPDTGESEGLLVEEARTNLVDKPFVDWTVTASAVITPNSCEAVDGTLTGNTIDLSGDEYARAYAPIATVKDSPYTYSVYVKGEPGTSLSIRLQSAKTVTTMTGQWQRVSVDNVIATDDISYVYIGYANGTSLAKFDVCMLQAEKGSFPTSPIPESSTFNSRASTATYYDSTGTLQTAAVDEARYTYNPADLTAPPVLMDEVERTNLLTYSADLLSGYSYSRSTIAASGLPTKIPGNVFTKWVENDTAGSSYLYKNMTFDADSTYTFSIDVKQFNGQRIDIELPATMGFSGMTMRFNPSTGKVDEVTGSTGSTNVQFLGDGIYRCSITDTCVTTTTANWIFARLSDSFDSPAYGLYVANAQLEQGSYPTSYIPTTSSQVTRLADNVTYSQSTRVADRVYRDLSGYEFGDEFSVYVNAKFFNTRTNPGRRDGIVCLSEFPHTQNVDSLLITRDQSSSKITVRARKNSTNSYSVVVNPAVNDDEYKMVLSYKQGNAFTCVNGTVTQINGLYIDAKTMKYLLVGAETSTGGFTPTSTTNDVKIYPKALSEAECLALTGGN